MIARPAVRLFSALLLVSIILPAHVIVVAEDERARYLRFDHMLQSGYLPLLPRASREITALRKAIVPRRP